MKLSLRCCYFLLIGSIVLLTTNQLGAQTCSGTVLSLSAPTHSTSGSIGTWTVPGGGLYKVRITAKGAKGGNAVQSNKIGGQGAIISGNFIVFTGQVLEAIAGAPGVDNTYNGGGGGGTGSQIQGSIPMIIAGAGGGGTHFGSSAQGGTVTNTGSGGGTGIYGAGGGGYITPGGGGASGTNGGGAGFGASGGASSTYNTPGGGGFGGGGGAGFNSGGGGGGYSGGNGGDKINSSAGGGGGSINYGNNQINIGAANNAGGTLTIECLGTATFGASVTATQPACGSIQGSLSIDLTGDNDGNTLGLEYAIVSGSSFTGTPTFTSISADPFIVSSGFGTTSSVGVNTYTIRTRLKYNPTIYTDYTYTLTNPALGDPTVFGTNTWNVYAWNAGGENFTNNTDSWNTNYAGYYTDNSLDINTTSRWDQNNSPSFASGYLGCPVQVNNMSFSAKRQGFPCSRYQINIPGHDDGAQLWVNGVMVWSEDGYNPNTITNVWTGWLGANDKLELKVTEGTGGSFGKLNLVPIAGGNGDPSVFGSNQWNVYAFNSGNGTFAGTNWSTNYSGYYTSTSLNLNTANDWPVLTSPSNASNYIGCTVSNDYMSFTAKRQGFPCGYYRLDIPGHDDGAQLWINETMVWSRQTYNPATITNVWAGWLGAADKVELRVTEGNFDAYGRLNFVPIANNVLYVDSSKAVGGNGTSWANAFKYLQDALVAAGTHSACINQIWVAKGTYFPDDGGGKTNNDRGASFSMKNNLAIYGGFAGTETQLGQRNIKTNEVILSGDIDQNDATLGNADNSYTIINNSGLNNTPVLDGFVIQAAYNTNINGNGGGIYNTYSSPTFVNCTIRNNYSRWSGSGAYNFFSSPVFINCLFLGNVTGGKGGALLAVANSVTLTNCTLVGNNGLGFGEAIVADNASFTINNCIIWGNNSGILLQFTSTAIINNSIVQGGCPGTATCTNVLNVDPLFVSQPPIGLGTAGNMRLKATSPGINSGNNTALPTGINTDLDGNARIQLGTVDMGTYEASCQITGNPSFFGSNQWNVYAYNSGNGTFAGTNWSTNYSGYYTSTSLNFNTENDWPKLTAPSNASNYIGCAVSNDYMSFAAKRQGVPCGYYRLDVPGHDDGAQLWINETMVWSRETYNTGTTTNVWTGWLGANDKVELRITEGIGEAFGRLNFVPISNNVLYVDSSKAAGGNGTSWANAFKYLQDALVAAGTYSTCINQIWVAKGTYFPDEGGGKTNNDRGASFSMKNNLAIYGGFSGTEMLLEQRNFRTNMVVLSGDIDQNDATLGNANNSYTIIKNSGLNNTPVLDGFVIQAANNTQINGFGGGINNDNSSPTFVNCTIRNNFSSQFGGGVCNSGSSPVFINCLFLGNVTGGRGGALYALQGTSVLTNCTLAGNNGLGYGEAMVGELGASFSINNCIIWGNTSGILLPGGTAVINNSIVQGGCPSNATCTNVLNIDPFFVSQPLIGLGMAGDLRLQSCSPAINAGSGMANLPTIDLDHNARIYGESIDLGAFEKQSAVTTFTSPLPTVNATITQIVQGNTYVGNCSTLYAHLQPVTGLNSIIGMVTAKVWVQTTQPSFNGKPYVKRHYEIMPATNASFSSAMVTLYFTQAEFDDFNNFPYKNGNIPTSPNDNIGKSNLRISKYSGTSSDGSGTPGSYTGGYSIIDPADNDIIWNTTHSRWEVSFQVTGFSGFFVGNSNSVILPVMMGNFSGTCNSTGKELRWNTLSEVNSKGFVVEGSTDGRNFSPLGFVAAKQAAANDYVFSTPSPANFFRLKQVDKDGQLSYSAIVQIDCNTIISKPILYPNPANGYTIISLPASQVYIKMELYDMLGRKLWQQAITGNATQQIAVDKLANGEYYLRLYKGSGGIEILKLAVVH